MTAHKRNEPRAWVGNILALTSAVAFAFSNTSASLAFHGGSNPMTLAAVRFVLPALVLVVWLTAQGRSVWLPKRDGWIAVALGAVTAAYSWALLSAISFGYIDPRRYHEPRLVRECSGYSGQRNGHEGDHDGRFGSQGGALFQAPAPARNTGVL